MCYTWLTLFFNLLNIKNMIYIKTSEISNALKNSKTLEEAARLVNITTKTFKEVMEIGNINIKGDKIK